MNNLERIKKIENILRENFRPSFLEVIDDSDSHLGHAGAESGKGHFELSIKSEYFNNMSLIQSHRAIYQVLGSLMQTDIHALQINVR